MVMGRPNKGVAHVDRCDGSQLSKQRTKLILQTITGELSVQEACDRLGIQRPRFAELRAKALQGSVDAIEPGRPGRPRTRDVDEVRREAEHQAELEELRHELRVAQAKIVVAELRADQKRGAAAKRARKRG